MSDQPITLVIAGGEISSGLSVGHDSQDSAAAADVLRSWLPEGLSEGINVIDWSHQACSHYTLRMTADLIELLDQQVAGGSRAIVALCGADAVEEMSYLADLLWIYPQPLIFAVTHNRPDAIGSDAKAILAEAVTAAASRETWGQGVLVCTQGQLFAASDVMELSNYGRSGFVGNHCGSVGEIVGSKVHMRQTPKRSKVFDFPFTPARNVEVLMSALGAGERFLEMLAENDGEGKIDGLVVAGFGGGNVYPAWVQHLKMLRKQEVPIVVVSRCTKGCVLEDANFEGSYSKLKELGILSGGFLNPLKARLKLAVGIGEGLKNEELQNYLLDL